MMKDKPTFPDNGVVYEGDYYKAIPFSKYIHDEEIPEGKVFDIKDFGAVADETLLSTREIQGAFDAARAAGGGVVLVSGGLFCCGTIRMYDNTTLFIERDSAIYASRDGTQYDGALLIIDGAANARICGGGRIIGNGEYFVYPPLKRPRLTPLEKIKLPPVLYDPMGYPVDSLRYEIRCRIRYAMDKYGDGLPKINRPMYMVWAKDCEKFQIENLILEDAMDWNLCIDGCKKVEVKDIVINGNRHVANTDGIDVMGSEDVSVSHCFISCADDGLVVKAPKVHDHDDLKVEEAHALRGTKNVSFRDCTVITVSNAFKIGTETYYDIENISIEDCRFILPDIYPGSCSGISIESADGSNVRNVRVKNITMDNVCCPLFICLNKRNKFGEDEKRFLGGSVSDVKIENVEAVNAEVPSIITGYRFVKDGQELGKDLGDISIEGFRVVYRDDKEELHIFDKIHESVTDYPENNAFGDVPAYGLFIRHAPSVALKDVDITPRSMNTRECIVREA